MRILQRQRDALAYLQDRRAPSHVVKAFGDLIDEAEQNWGTDPTGLFQGAPGGVLTPTVAPAIPDFTNYNTSFLAPFSAGATSSQVLPQNKKRTLLLIQNLSLTANLFFSLGSGASVNNGIQLAASQGIVFDVACPNDSVNVFFDSSTVQLGIILEVRFST